MLTVHLKCFRFKATVNSCVTPKKSKMCPSVKQMIVLGKDSTWPDESTPRPCATTQNMWACNDLVTISKKTDMKTGS